MDNRASLEFFNNLLKKYQMMCKPLCRKFALSQTAFDILLFLANNPECRTARDVVEIRGIKANLVSINVDKLVHEGLLEREDSLEDRRVVFLVCTEKADKIMKEGQKIQKQFMERLFANVSGEEKEIFYRVLDAMGRNVKDMGKEGI